MGIEIAPGLIFRKSHDHVNHTYEKTTTEQYDDLWASCPGDGDIDCQIAVPFLYVPSENM